MHSTLNPKQADPHDVYMTAPDVVPAAHADGGLYNSAREAMGLPPDPQAQMAQAHAGYESSAGSAVPPVDTTFRAAAVGNTRLLRGQRSMGVRAMRGVIGFLLAVCVGVAGALWQSHGDLAQESVQQAAQQLMAKWMPKFVATSSPAAENPAPADQSASSTDQAAATTATISTASPQPASVAQTTSASAAADAAASAADSAQLQSMAQDLAAAKQEIEQLKASVAQLKAGQDQMSREVARVTESKVSDVRPPEPALRPRLPPPPSRPVVLGAPPRPLAAPVRRPPPPPPPPLRSSQAAPIPLQAAPPPPPPVARQYEPPPVAPPPQQGEQMSSVLRPPMPVP
jgi:hypothetical protein